MRSLARIGLMLVLGASGCGGGSSGGDGGTLGDVAGACTNLLAHCPTDYAWSSFVSDQAMCLDVFACVHDLYTGDCRTRMEHLVDCAAGLTGPGGCDDCNAIAVGVTQDCPLPGGLLLVGQRSSKGDPAWEGGVGT